MEFSHDTNLRPHIFWSAFRGQVGEEIKTLLEEVRVGWVTVQVRKRLWSLLTKPPWNQRHSRCLGSFGHRIDNMNPCGVSKLSDWLFEHWESLLLQLESCLQVDHVDTIKAHKRDGSFCCNRGYIATACLRLISRNARSRKLWQSAFLRGRRFFRTFFRTIQPESLRNWSWTTKSRKNQQTNQENWNKKATIQSLAKQPRLNTIQEERKKAEITRRSLLRFLEMLIYTYCKLVTTDPNDPKLGRPLWTPKTTMKTRFHGVKLYLVAPGCSTSGWKTKRPARGDLKHGWIFFVTRSMFIDPHGTSEFWPRNGLATNPRSQAERMLTMLEALRRSQRSGSFETSLEMVKTGSRLRLLASFDSDLIFLLPLELSVLENDVNTCSWMKRAQCRWSFIQVIQ